MNDFSMLMGVEEVDVEAYPPSNKTTHNSMLEHLIEFCECVTRTIVATISFVLHIAQKHETLKWKITKFENIKGKTQGKL